MWSGFKFFDGARTANFYSIGDQSVRVADTAVNPESFSDSHVLLCVWLFGHH